MKAPGDYALLKANGMSWADVVAAIRVETLRHALMRESEIDDYLSEESD